MSFWALAPLASAPHIISRNSVVPIDRFSRPIITSVACLHPLSTPSASPGTSAATPSFPAIPTLTKSLNRLLRANTINTSLKAG